ncbi:MAG: hypothetical protein PHO64_14830 [Thiomonas sp.]|nr:hypothetical protein [Thiomonas sp.]
MAQPRLHLLLALGFQSSLALADETTLLAPVTVTSTTKTQTALDKVTASTEVITESDITRLGAITLTKQPTEGLEGSIAARTGGTSDRTNRNIANARVQGIELRSGCRLLSKLRLKAATTRPGAKDTTTGQAWNSPTSNLRICRVLDQAMGPRLCRMAGWRSALAS